MCALAANEEWVMVHHIQAEVHGLVNIEIREQLVFKIGKGLKNITQGLDPPQLIIGAGGVSTLVLPTVSDAAVDRIKKGLTLRGHFDLAAE
jgi:hypothetical protein